MSPAPVTLRDRLSLIVITDQHLAGARGIFPVVEAALDAGAPAIQYREKELGAGDALPIARRLREMTRAHGALLFINDRLDLALASDADGVHLGPTDLPVAAVRPIVPEGFLVGYSTDDPARAQQAQAQGADYLGCGTVWPTSSKEDAGAVIGLQGLQRVVEAVEIPVVAIGGITPARARELGATGVAGAAVMGAIMGAPDPVVVVKQLVGLGRNAERPR